MLLDTSGLFCLLHRAESYHELAVSLNRSTSPRMTHSYVLAEFVALANARNLPRSIVLSFMTDLIDNPEVETVWVSESDHRTALALLGNRMDKTYSLCDAVSFLLMRKRGVAEALTTDRHFEQEGYLRLLA